jgi:anti-sigma regulatory factor (Ser/Thr protein kinase)
MSVTATMHDMTMTLPCETQSARTARRELEHLLRAAGWAPLDTEWALLVVTELVANAVVHARTDVVVRCRVGARLRLEVTDGAGDAALRPRFVGPEHTRGRGLGLVAAVSRAWGVVRGPATKTVWCEITRTRQDLAAAG